MVVKIMLRILILTLISANAIHAGYIACYKETPRRRTYSANPAALKTVTPQTCSSICGGMSYGYAVLGNGGACLCGNSDPSITLTQVAESKCNQPCADDPGQMCGSTYHVNVYDAILPITVELATAAYIVATGSPVTLIPTVVTAGSGYQLAFYYNDNAGQSEFAPSGAGLTTHTYYQSGRYEVTVTATNSDLSHPGVQSAVGVHVITKPTAFDLTCPPNMATYETSYCDVTVPRGTHMVLNANYYNGLTNIQTSFSIPDANEYSIGNPVRTYQSSPTVSSTNTDGLILQLGTQAEYQGTLVALEYYAANAGTLTVYVYRPACAPSEYCYASNQCVSPGSCNIACGVGIYCGNSQTCCSGPTARSSAPLTQYTKVYQTTVAVSAGSHVYDVVSGPEISPGDILAHDRIPATPLLSMVTDTAVHDYYCPTVHDAATVTSSGCSATNEKHQLKAIYATESRARIRFDFTSSGPVLLTVNVRNRDGTFASDVTRTANINVLQGIDKCSLKVPKYVPAKEDVQFTLEPFTGTSPSVLWTFGNGDTRTVTTDPLHAVTYQYPSHGTYQLSVNISNALSYKECSMEVCVQEQITDLALVFSTPLEVGSTTALQLTMSSGTDYTCSLSIVYSSTATTVTVDLDYVANPPSSTINNNVLVAGTVVMSLSCSNDISTVVFNKETQALERITGLRLDPPAALLDVEYNIVVRWDSGTDVSATLKFDSTDETITMSEDGTYAISDTKMFSLLATHSVQVTAWNDLGTETLTENFYIVEEMRGADIQVNFPGKIASPEAEAKEVIQMGSDAECDITAVQGTGIGIKIVWGDGSADWTYLTGTGSWVQPAMPVTHTYTDPGEYEMIVSLGNGYDDVVSTYTVAVMMSVENLTLDAIEGPSFFGPPATFNFQWSAPGSPQWPNMVSAEISWGEGNSDTWTNIDLAANPVHNYYDGAGDLTVNWHVWNYFSSKTGSFIVSVVTPILNPDCSGGPSAGIPNDPVNVVFTSQRRPGIGLSTLTFDLNDGSGPLPFRVSTTTAPFGEEIEAATYSSPGVYTPTVRIDSLLDSQTCSHTINIMNPVTDHFAIQGNTPIDYMVNYSCNAIFEVSFTGPIHPDNAYITFDYGDGTALTTPVTFVNTATETHSYADPGVYATTIRIFNDASEVIKMIESGCYAVITTVSATIKRQPALPIGTPPVIGFNGGTEFRSDESLVITGTQDGTLGWWEVSAIDGSKFYHCNSTDPDTIYLDIPEPGHYTVTVQANNPVYINGPIYTTSIVVIQEVGTITITSPVITSRLQSKTFSISMAKYGTSMCVGIADGQSSAIHVYGETATCNVGSVPEWPTRTVSFHSGYDVTTAFDVSFQYNSEADFTLVVYAWNVYSSQRTEFPFPVSSIDCSAPNIDIEAKSDSPGNAKEYKRSQAIKIAGKTAIECAQTLENDKSWYIKKFDEITMTEGDSVSLDAVESYHNAELSLDSNFLSYGYYKVTYEVKMHTAAGGSGAQFGKQVFTFIRIAKSNLVVQLFKNSANVKTVGNSAIVVINPAMYSSDPDVNTAEETNTFDRFEISCIDLTNNEVRQPQSVVIQPKTLEELPPGHTSTGGCFQEGPGWFVLYGTDSLTVNTSIMTPGSIYEFHVIGYKDDRSAEFTGRLKVMTDDPPDIEIGLMQIGITTPSSEGILINANNELGLQVTFASTCPGCTCQWEVSLWDYDYVGNVYDGWRPLPYLPIYIEGTNSEELTIHTALFDRYSSGELFKVALTCTDLASISGQTTVDLRRNPPPSGGSCTITPTSGTSLVTQNTIQCSGYTDSDGIQSYTVLCHDGVEDKVVIRGYESSWDNIYLPSGDPTNGDVLKCHVEVEDTLGAIKSDPIHDVTSAAQSFDDLKAELDGWIKQPHSFLHVIDAVAVLSMTTGFINAISTSFVKLSSNDESVYTGNGGAVSFTATSLSNEVRTKAFTEDDPDPVKLAEYQANRNNAGTVCKSLVKTLRKTTIEAVADIDEAIHTVSVMTKTQTFIFSDTVDEILALMTDKVAALKRKKNLISVEQAKSLLASTVETCHNLQSATSNNAHKPATSDVDKQEGPVRYFPTSLNSETPDMTETFDNPEDQKNAGMLIMNTQYQTTFSSTITSTCRSLTIEMNKLMIDIRPMSNTPFTYVSESVELVVQKSPASTFAGVASSTRAGSVTMPAALFGGITLDSAVTFVFEGRASPGLVINDGQESAADARSRCLVASYLDENGNEMEINNLAEPVDLEVERDPNRKPDNDSALEFANPAILESRPDDLGHRHAVTIVKANSGILIQFLNVTNVTETNQLLVLINHEVAPDVDNVTKVCMIPWKTSKAGKTCTHNGEEDPYSCFVPGDLIKNNVGKYIIMVRQLARKELNKYRGKLFLKKKTPGQKLDWEKVPFVQDYVLKTVELSCAYTKTGSTQLKTEGCYPQPVCNGDSIKCKCTHLTSFAGGWVVAPNAIDWDFIFSNADFLKNPTLYVTQIIIVLVYIISMIWARRRDRQDLTKMGLAPLLDNVPQDRYYYEIMVNTGLRRNAGTESKVHFILSGEEDETDVRTFTDKKRKIFQRGNTDGFLMAVESTLGALSYLRIWHDNSGKGKSASWYLNHIIVRDVQTDKKYYFISNKWFAVEEDDGQVDRVIPVAGKEQMTEFSYMFSERATKNLSDGHLWFSVVARPPQSRFTRCQRVSCCLCLLYMSMLANAMFYGTESSDSTAYSFGPFALTPEQIFIGVACNIIIFPINFLIITLFRKSRPRKLRPSRVEEALKSMPERTTSMTDVNMRMKSSMSVDRPGSSFLIDAKRSESSMSRPDSSLGIDAASKKSKKKKCTLPWWFTIVSWILLWLAVMVSMAFVTFYGIQFQDIKCKKWITSMLISFFTSVFLTQPIKVFLFAIIFSLIIKNPGGDEEEDEDEEPTRKLENDEEFLHQEDDGYGLIAPRRPMYKPKPPDQKSLESARQLRLKEIQMWSVIREILFYAFFLWILLVISYKSVSTNSYHYKHNMEKVFVWTTNTNHSFTNITNVGSFWSWARIGMLRGLRAGPYYNNFPPFYMRGYINDKVSRIMGYAVLRQLRVEPGSCKVPYQVDNIIDECNAPFSSRVEEQKDFGPGWSNVVNQSRPEYTYTDSDILNGYPYWGEMAMYSGGGYVVRLNKDYQVMFDHFKQLEQEKWIDEYTRAVFLEFTVYNPAINMFAISTMLAEFRPSGGVFTTYRFEPATLLPYMSSVLLFQIICEIVYFLFTVSFVIKEIRAFYKQRLKYFYQFWNIIELCICAMSVTAIVIYFYRLVCINELTEYFSETNGDGYMKFQYVGYWSEIFSYIIGFLVYFACLKFLKLLRFNKRVSLLADTLKNSAKDLIHFSIIFNIVFLAFIQVFYLIYVARINTFKTFLSSCEAGIVMMMGKFDIYNMLEVNQWLTQIFLFLFVVTITFIVVNMFLSILNDTFGAVRDNMSKQSNDYEIVEFMMSRFKMWTGVGRGAGTTISPSDLESEKKKNYTTLEGQIDYFPDQIDRFLASISNMYVEKSKFDDFLHQGAYGKMAQKAQMKAAMHPAPKPGSTRLSHGAKGMTDIQTD